MDFKNAGNAIILAVMLITFLIINASAETPIEKEHVEMVEAVEESKLDPIPPLTRPKSLETVEPLKITPEKSEEYLHLTPEEKRLFATLIYHEARGESYECQLAVGSTVLNRMKVLNMTLREVIFQKYRGVWQFSPAPLLERKDENGNFVWEPYEEQWQVVEQLCTDGPTLPYYVLFFRADYHFDWAIPYCEIGDTYFSYMEMHK